MLNYPLAVIDMDYVNKLQDRYDATVLAQRVDVLVEKMRIAGQDRANITEYAIIDVVKRRKVHFFLSNLKYRKKMLTKVMSIIKKGP